MDDEIYGKLSDGDFYFATSSYDNLNLFQEPVQQNVQYKKQITSYKEQLDYLFFNDTHQLLDTHFSPGHETLQSLLLDPPKKRAIKKYVEVVKPLSQGESCTLKRGPKLMTNEEKINSKNEFIKLYQDIWRLLFRKNSIVTLSLLGKQCCSYYNNKTLTQCPSGKSLLNDLFRTIEHIWNVIEFGKNLNIKYSLRQFFFMKILFYFKLQPRFTDCQTRPDIEPLENDRIYQNGKTRKSLPILKEIKPKTKLECETIEKQKHSLWLLLNQMPSLDFPGIDNVFKFLNDLFSNENFTETKLSWPFNPTEICLEKEGLEGKVFLSAKILSTFGSLIRKKVITYIALKNPCMAKSYDESCIETTTQNNYDLFYNV